MSLELSKLRLLSKVYESGSVTTTGLEMGLSQSSVSYALDQLREDFHDPLFVKVGRNLVPTPFLSQRIPAILAAISELESLPKRKNFSPEEYVGPITILANVSEQLPFLKKVSESIRHQVPRSRVRLLELGSRSLLLKNLESQDAACAITVSLVSTPPELVSQKLMTSKQLIFYDNKVRSPITSLEEYLDAKHAVLDFGGNSTSTVERSLNGRGHVRKVVVGVPNTTVLVDMIMGSDMICTMQEALARSVFKGLANCPVPFPMPEISFDLVWHRRDQADPLSVWLRGLIVECYKDMR